eukprot:5121524-Amphidinium_carterae.1
MELGEVDVDMSIDQELIDTSSSRASNPLNQERPLQLLSLFKSPRLSLPALTGQHSRAGSHRSAYRHSVAPPSSSQGLHPNLPIH